MLIGYVSLVWIWQLLLSFYAKLPVMRVVLIGGSIVAAAVYSSSLSPDHVLYVPAIANYGTTSFAMMRNEVILIEPLFLVLAKLVHRLDLPGFFLFLTFAVISVTLKISLIAKESKNLFISLALYFSYFFLIHDSTQIRASTSIAVLFWAAYHLSQDRRVVFVGLVGIATALLHASSLAFLPVLLLRRKATPYLLVLLGAAIVMFALRMSPTTILESFLSAVGGDAMWGVTKLANYATGKEEDEAFNPVGLISLATLAFAAMVWRHRREFTEFEVICFNCLLVSIIIAFVLFDFGVVQTRLRAIYSFSMVFLAPYLLVRRFSATGFNIATTVALFGFFLFFAVGKKLLVN